jgi:hypothetical protein
MEDFNTILSNYLSPDSTTRQNAETKINQYLTANPYYLDVLFSNLQPAQTNDQVKLFIAMIIKKIFETNINEENYLLYLDYIQKRKADIVNNILNLKSDFKTLNYFVLILEKCVSLFKENFALEEIFQYIFEFYNYNKAQGNVDETFRGLYISFKLLKTLDKESNFRQNEFYNKIVNDYNEILILFFNALEGSNFEQAELLAQYINLYLKIAKHSVNFLLKEHRESIMNLTLDFLNRLLFNYGNILTKTMFESIFLSNRILIKYTAYVEKLELQIIKKFAELFYLYINNSTIYQNILNIIRVNFQANNIIKERKFVTDIIDFMKELLQLTAFDNWGDLLIFKDAYSDQQIIISDYLTTEFFTDDKLQNIVIFVINNCLCFSSIEIELAQGDIEDFYTWYDTLSPAYDLREKAGMLVRIIYDKFKKNMKPFFANLENELLNLSLKEYASVFEGGQQLNADEINLKCGLLSFFDYLAYIYFNKHRDYDMWIWKILLNPLKTFQQTEPFSKYIILRILMKIIDFKEVKEYRVTILTEVFQIFIIETNNANVVLLKIAIIDFLYAYFDEILGLECPDNFLKNYIFQICLMIKVISSPDVHHKIIKTTSSVLEKFNDVESEILFPQIFPVLRELSNNIFMNTINNKTNISVIRQNFLKLISIFIKKMGIFVDNNFTEYFNFVYNLIAYSISIKSPDSNFVVQEAIRLILLIQDEFYRLNFINKNLSENLTNKPQEFYIYFALYLRLYDFLPSILDNLTVSDDYFFNELLLIEQYVALINLPEVRTVLLNIGFMERIRYIIDSIRSKYLDAFHQPIFNFIEYLLFALNSYGELNTNFNSYIFELVELILFKSGSTNIDIILGGIQLANRLLYIMKNFNMIDYNFAFKIIEIISFILQQNNEEISLQNKKIMNNFIKNLIVIFSTYPDNANVLMVLKNLLQSFNELNKSNYIDKYQHTINHWLYFFNKMNNSSYYYQFSNCEDILRNEWTAKFEKTTFFQVDVSDIVFEFKYYSLLGDTMYKGEDDFIEQNELN